MASGHHIDSLVVDLQIGFFLLILISVFHSYLLKMEDLRMEISLAALEYMRL